MLRSQSIRRFTVWLAGALAWLAMVVGGAYAVLLAVGGGVIPPLSDAHGAAVIAFCALVWAAVVWLGPSLAAVAVGVLWLAIIAAVVLWLISPFLPSLSLDRIIGDATVWQATLFCVVCLAALVIVQKLRVRIASGLVAFLWLAALAWLVLVAWLPWDAYAANSLEPAPIGFYEPDTTLLVFLGWGASVGTPPQLAWVCFFWSSPPSDSES